MLNIEKIVKIHIVIMLKRVIGLVSVTMNERLAIKYTDERIYQIIAVYILTFVVTMLLIVFLMSSLPLFRESFTTTIVVNIVTMALVSKIIISFMWLPKTQQFNIQKLDIFQPMPNQQRHF